MTEPLTPPPRKNPLKRTLQPLLPPQARSRAAHLLTWAAAEGRLALPSCVACGHVHYPVRDVCPQCLASDITLRDVLPDGKVLATTTIQTSTDPYFRERMPWRIGTVVLAAGPVIIAHLHGDCAVGQAVTLALKLDKGGQAVAIALPSPETPNMADDPILRELTADPKHRRVLVTDGRCAVGQAVARALSDAGAAIVFVGLSDAWKPVPGRAALEKVRGVEIVPLDVTDTDSVRELVASIGGKVDILINTAEHARPGGIIDRGDVQTAREEMDIGYFGLMRLAQGFGPAMRARGADGSNSACAWVNTISIYGQMAWPAFGAHSAMQAAILATSQSLRAELRTGGVRVVNIFTGPLETEWFQTVPPPKVAPTQIAKAIVEALKGGVEDVYVGDVAKDFRARLDKNPKALERELG
jgi:NAD(P)-dependent dehydrogenase (short-subunit alcohol dehydrogenase family)/uncharacterized OB-fold protein